MDRKLPLLPPPGSYIRNFKYITDIIKLNYLSHREWGFCIVSIVKWIMYMSNSLVQPFDNYPAGIEVSQNMKVLCMELHWNRDYHL